MIRRMGVEFRFGVAIDPPKHSRPSKLNSISIFLGIGLGAMQQLGIPGEGSDGVMNALELIAAYKTGHLRELSGTVVVVGAGTPPSTLPTPRGASARRPSTSSTVAVSATSRIRL